MRSTRKIEEVLGGWIQEFCGVKTFYDLEERVYVIKDSGWHEEYKTLAAACEGATLWRNTYEKMELEFYV